MEKEQSANWTEWSKTVSLLVQEIDDLLAAFRPLADLIQKEHSVALSRDIDAIESVGEEKKKIASNINNTFSKLGETIRASCGKDVQHLSACLNRMKQKASSLNARQEASDYEKKLLKKLEAVVHKVLEVSDDLRPKIERNKLILEKLLTFHRHSIQFWADLIHERSSFYGADGSKVSADTAIQLNVEA